MGTNLHRVMQWCGEVIAKLWLAVAALTLLLVFQVSGMVASLLVGYAAFKLAGAGTFGVIALCVSAYLFGLFLAVYVWEPHMKDAVHSAADIMSKAAADASNGRDARAVLKAFEAAQNWPPKRAPEQTAAAYHVLYSDGLSQQTQLTSDEIDRWAIASNNESRSLHPALSQR
jgi:hypothetical protein